MRDGLIGPGQGCFSCGEVYGMHKSDCYAEKNRKEAERAEAHKIGKAFLKAILSNDTLRMGRIIRDRSVE